MNDIIAEIAKVIDTDDISEEREYFLFHENRFIEIFSILQKFERNKKVLDISSASLHVPLGAHFMGFKDLHATDISFSNKTLIDRAARFGIALKDCDLEKEKLPFSDSTFDIVLLTETLEHFNFHPGKAMSEISRVLAPEGVVIITTPNLVRLNNRIKMLIGKSINYDIKEKYHPGIHFREYTAQEICYLLDSADIKTDQVIFADFKYPGRGHVEASVNRLLGKFFSSLKNNVIVIGKKK